MAPFEHVPGLLLAICLLVFIAICIIAPLVYDPNAPKNHAKVR
jgi:hypothetical protein